MIIFSVAIYIVLSAWFLFGNEKSQRASTFIGVCISSFFAYYYWDVIDVAMMIYIIMGLVCVFFHWISVGNSSKGKAKNKFVAALLALFLGSYGVHRFYLRKSTSGLLYVLFCWSLIPCAISIVEAIYLFVISKDKFNSKYNVGTEQDYNPEQKIIKKQKHQKQQNTIPNENKCDNCESEDNQNIGVNERNDDSLNYHDIRIGGYNAEAVGSIEDFTITVRANGNSYTFKTKDGNICSYRSSVMRETKHYEVN